MEFIKTHTLEELGMLTRGRAVPTEKTAPAGPGKHAFSRHVPVWSYESPRFMTPFPDKTKRIFGFTDPETPISELSKDTRLVVLLGADLTPQFLEVLGNNELSVIIFEPDEAMLERLLDAIHPALLYARKNLRVFLGDPYSFTPALQEHLTQSVFAPGYPVFLVSDRIAAAYDEWSRNTTEYVEILFYRHRIYGISGQALMRSQPIRNIVRSFFYDQQYHFYKNFADTLLYPDIRELQDTLKGRMALLVGAGPTLPQFFDYIRSAQNRAVIICVNNSLKPLLENGIEPDFVVINDTSLAAAEVFKHIQQTKRTILVGHCLADLGGDKFRQKYLFGTIMPEVFGTRPYLRLHGSVISTAFSLARHLGCGKCVFIGAQLASHNPWGLSYAKGTVHEGKAKESEKPLTHKYPQLLPCTLPNGHTVYTSLNFRDAAIWLAEEIRQSGVECYNVLDESILTGEGITFDPAPALPEEPLAAAMKPLYGRRNSAPRIKPVLSLLERETRNWTLMIEAVGTLLKREGMDFVNASRAMLEQFDQNNVSCLVERFEDYSNAHFHELALQSDDPARVEEGFRYYMKAVRKMSISLLATLKAEAAELESLLR